MKLVTLGSKVLDDAIKLNKELSNEYRMVGVSPFSFNTIYHGKVPELTYCDRMFNIECDGNIKEIIKCDFDFLIIDFLSALNILFCCNKEGMKKYFTKYYFTNEHKKELFGEFNIIEEFNPLDFTNNELSELIVRFCENLSFIPSEKIVLVKWFIPYQFLRDSSFINDEIDEISRINGFLDTCHKIFLHYFNCKSIDMPRTIVRISESVFGENFDIAEHCKYFLADMLSNILQEENYNKIVENYDKMHKKYIESLKDVNISIVLKDFLGHYSDCLLNEIYTDTKTNIGMSGRQNKIILNGVELNSNPLYINCINSFIEINNKSTFAENCCIYGNNGVIHMGKDVMFSTGIDCYVDNGTINIGNHVWVGYQAKIQTGADISGGSIIGARSTVNHYVPNNCIVVGEDGHIVRKDIYWAREPFTNNIADEEYANFTNCNDLKLLQ